MQADTQKHITINHDYIVRWIRERGGVPAVVNAPLAALASRLRINFAEDDMEDSSQEVTWGKFFEEFENNRLALQYRQATRDGRASFFYKFIDRV